MFLPFHPGIGIVLTKIFSKKRLHRSNIAESHGALPQSIPLCLRRDAVFALSGPRSIAID